MPSSFRFILVLLFLFTIHYSLFTNFASAQVYCGPQNTSNPPAGGCIISGTCPDGQQPSGSCYSGPFPGCVNPSLTCVYSGGITGINPPILSGMRFNNPTTLLVNIVSRFLLYATALTGAFFLYRTITAGFTYMTSVGDPAKVQSATKQLTNALTGLIVVVSAYFIIQIVQLVFGISIL